MKRFVAKLSVFSVIVLLLCVVLGIVMYRAEKKAYLNGIKLGQDCDIVILGDSRSAQNVNPELINGCVNLSRSGLWPRFWEMRIEDIVAVNADDGKKRKVVIEIRPFSLVGRERFPRIADYQRVWSFWWIMHPELFKVADFNNYLLSYMAAEFPVRFVMYVISVMRGRSFTSSLVGGFEMPSVRSGYTEDEFGTMIVKVGDELKQLKDQEFNFSRFDRMAKTIKGIGWEPVFVSYPEFVIERNRDVAIRFRSEMADFAKRNGIRWIDLSGECQELEYWCDGGHLNQRGAESIWRRMAEELQNRKDALR